MGTDASVCSMLPFHTLSIPRGFLGLVSPRLIATSPYYRSLPGDHLGWFGNALGALVALLGLFGVGAVVCAIVWTLFAWSGRWFDWPLFCSPARARINYDLRGLAAWVVLGSPACNPSIGRTDPPLGRGLEMRCHHRSTSSYDPALLGDVLGAPGEDGHIALAKTRTPPEQEKGWGSRETHHRHLPGGARGARAPSRGARRGSGDPSFDRKLDPP
jgi:hypothetical protein